MPRSNQRRKSIVALLGVWCLGSVSVCLAADAPSAEFALTFRPTQTDVDYEIPNAVAAKQCKVTVERYSKGSGWVVNGPAGQVLRRFVDSNDDKIVDQWRYYRDSVEVYRDQDTDFNKQVDQMRWFNSGGSRWGIDKNEDGKIDTWKVLSPEELAREAVKALITKDERLLSTLVLSSDEITRLGFKAELADGIRKNLSNLGGQMEKLSSVKMLSSKAKWLQFQGTLPSTIPFDQAGSREDILTHQNAMTLIENEGQTGLIQLGTLIRVGDTWKLTRMPQPLEGNSVQVAEDGLFSPAMTSETPTPGPTPGNTENPKIQKLIEELQAHDKKTPGPTASKASWSDFNKERTAALRKLVAASDTTEERDQWQKQIADGIAAGVQSDTYADGLEQLKSMLVDIEKKTPKSSLVAYLTYRIMTAEYSLKLRKAPTDKTAEIQEQWLKSLEAFVTKYPAEDDSPEAMFQLGSTYEFSGKTKDARTWYVKLSSTASETPSGARAKGALSRLDSKGENFNLKGKDLSGATVDIAAMKGKVVLVIYWANWSEPLVKDLPQIRALYEQYRDRGLEILGVNLDATKEDAQAWISQHKVDWKQLHEEGGLEGSPLAVEYGIIHLPSMFVIDRASKVVYRGIAAEELKPVFADLLKSEDKAESK
ncbi:MAG: redoxin domain-containing protein [Planctomycetota bacterium]